MAFKLIEAAQQRWRAVDAPHLVARIRAGTLAGRAYGRVAGDAYEEAPMRVTSTAS
ncbi:hypothetical protein ACWT_3336 [Actinoplanes sp. SE50]|uniref:hypothetical protein n=1 Tax=unclassified Actinoplanes TaxID=2626549 RepID=UPI00023ED05D|nr:MULTISPECIES: hypothetical protein [unclassified Actinoplanes]AEV84359.1 hypothetical protein ACPL_3464 [Actinoplanes sp. SE50/110]ATO82751.1 hypothetical protein ACWT_3336 [Actinoplanes sp. SE50]SLM00158.1 hypothetical protein ACSP50_3390 [Actinoplanes sp. SE50/110]